MLALLLKIALVIGCMAVMALVLYGFSSNRPAGGGQPPALRLPRIPWGSGLLTIAAVALIALAGVKAAGMLGGSGAAEEASPAAGTQWLSDFESPAEHVFRWYAHRVKISRVEEHATRGRYAAKLTFRGGPGRAPLIRMDQYLGWGGGRDWRGFGTLAFDVYNPAAEMVHMTLRLESQDGRLVEKRIELPAQIAQPVRVALDGSADALDLGNIKALSLIRPSAKAPVELYVDAFRLEPPLSGTGDRGHGTRTDTGAIRFGTVTKADTTHVGLTPDELEAMRFRQGKARWEAQDPESGDTIVRVPLTVVGPNQPLSAGFSISGGVPFPMGELAPDAAVRLHDDGGAVWPVQIRPLAVWKDGTVKWLLVTALVPMNAKGRRVWLEYGPAVSVDAPPAVRVSVTETPDAVQVDTGVLRFSINKKRFTLFADAGIDVDGNGELSGVERMSESGDMVIMHRGRAYRSSLDAQTYELAIEESGPLRATLKASGWFRDKTGNGFCRFSVRLQAFAGLPQVRLYHTFIYTGYPENTVYYEYKGLRLPDNETIQAIRLELPVTGELEEVLTADEGGVLTMPFDGSVRALQRRHDRYELFRGAAAEPVHGAARHQGWMLVQHPLRGGAMVSLRDAWQQYPKALSADAASGKLVLDLWPQEAGELDLSTGPEAKGTDAHGRGSAFGLAKTHELVVSFIGTGVDGATAQGLAGLWQEPWLLSAHPEWLSATGVLGTIGPVQLDRFPGHEHMLDALFAWAERQGRDFSWYGMLDYGDTQTMYRNIAPDGASPDWGWHPDGRFGWHNSETMGSHGGALVSFLRTHNLKYFRFAEAKARHVMDVDTVHHNTVAEDRRVRGRITDAFSKVGSMHRHNAYHWGGRNEEATHTSVWGILLYYYLTGYERAKDVAEEVGEFLLLDPVTYRLHPDNAPSRGIANVLWGDLDLYEATGDARYRAGADRWADVLVKGQQRDGTWLETYNPLFGSWRGEVKSNYITLHILPALIAYHRLTGNPAAAGAIVRGTDAMLQREPYLPFFDSLAYCFLLTGSERYVEEGLWRIQKLHESQRLGGDPIWDGMIYQKAYYDRVGPFLYSVPHILGAVQAPSYRAIISVQERIDDPAAPANVDPVGVIRPEGVLQPAGR